MYIISNKDIKTDRWGTLHDAMVVAYLVLLYSTYCFQLLK